MRYFFTSEYSTMWPTLDFQYVYFIAYKKLDDESFNSGVWGIRSKKWMVEYIKEEHSDNQKCNWNLPRLKFHPFIEILKKPGRK